MERGSKIAQSIEREDKHMERIVRCQYRLKTKCPDCRYLYSLGCHIKEKG